MKKKNRNSSLKLSKETGHSFFDHKFSNKESKLIENGFLLSSVVELLSTRAQDQYQLKPKEYDMFVDLATYLEKIQSANTYMASEKTQLMLHSEDLDLLTTVETLSEKSLNESIPNALNTVKTIIAKQSISVENQQSNEELADLLRTLFNGIRVTISQNDELFDKLS